MRWTQAALATRKRGSMMAQLADGQAVWSWHPDAGVWFVGSNFHRRRWLTSPAHRGDHGGAAKTIAQEMPGAPGEPVVNTLVCLFTYLHARLRAHRAPGISCALLFSRDGRLMHNPGEIAPRECESVRCHCEERLRRSNPETRGGET